MWACLAPMLSSVPTAGSSFGCMYLDHPSLKDKFVFVFCKWWAVVPSARLITLNPKPLTLCQASSTRKRITMQLPLKGMQGYSCTYPNTKRSSAPKYCGQLGFNSLAHEHTIGISQLRQSRSAPGQAPPCLPLVHPSSLNPKP